MIKVSISDATKFLAKKDIYALSSIDNYELFD